MPRNVIRLDAGVGTEDEALRVAEQVHDEALRVAEEAADTETGPGRGHPGGHGGPS